MTAFPKAYVSYLVEFHASRDYFECHELLEEYWKEHPSDPLADTWVGFIQLAVGSYHERRGNQRGAFKMFKQAERRLLQAPLDQLGIESDSLFIQLSNRLASVQTNEKSPFIDINLFIIDDELRRLCREECDERGLTWGSPSPMDNDALIHRHSLRDRSGVIAARQEAHLAKKKERNSID